MNKKLFDKIEEIINDDFIEVVPNKGFFYLIEDVLPRYPKTLVRYHKLKSFLPCKFDVKNSNDLFKIFDVRKANLSTICDYILFFLKDGILFIFLCNLKSKNISGSSNQIKASWILTKYIIATASRLRNFEKFKIEFRGLTFSTSNITTRFSTNPRKDNFDVLGKSGLRNIHLKAGKTCYLDFLCR